jgi:HK97 family phage major capsid protein
MEKRQLIEERRELLRQIRELTPEEQAQFDALTAKVDDIDARLAALEEAAAPAQDQTPAGTRRLTRDSVGPLEIRNMTEVLNDSDFLKSFLRAGTFKERAGDRQAIEARGFSYGQKEIEFRAQSKGTASAGGYTVPTGFLAQVSDTLKNVAPIRSVAQVITTDSGEDLKFPTCDDTSNNGRILSEGSQNTSTDLTFGEITLKAFKYSSDLVVVSSELLNDTGIDLSAYLARQLGNRIGRLQGSHFISGNGTTQPQGLVTAASTTSAASASAIAVSDLINLIAAVDPAYITGNNSVRWVMHPTIWYSLRKLNDSSGRALLGDSAEGADLMLLGYPVVLDSNMDSTIAASKKSVIFGAMDQYLIRDVSGLVVKRDDSLRFDYDQSCFVCYSRMDAKVLQAGAFRALVH